MLQGRSRWAVATAATFVVGMLGVPAAADESTTVSITGTQRVGAQITVTGTAAYGADALGPAVLSTGGSGTAVVNGAGFDIGNVSVETNLAASRLVVTLGLHDGLPAPVDGPGPATGYMVPIMADGQDWWRWLGAGSYGTNLPPRTGKWGALCHNEVDGQQGGWSCTDNLNTTITADAVRWDLPFNRMKPGIQHGSTIESGSILCGAPCSFKWPSAFALGGLVSMDSNFPIEQYKVPGEVQLGIAPAGTPPGSVTFGSAATLTPSNGSFTGAVGAPAAPGEYAVFARTCFGTTPLTCVIGTSDIEIA